MRIIIILVLRNELFQAEGEGGKFSPMKFLDVANSEYCTKSKFAAPLAFCGYILEWNKIHMYNTAKNKSISIPIKFRGRIFSKYAIPNFILSKFHNPFFSFFSLNEMSLDWKIRWKEPKKNFSSHSFFLAFLYGPTIAVIF